MRHRNMYRLLYPHGVAWGSTFMPASAQSTAYGEGFFQELLAETLQQADAKVTFQSNFTTPQVWVDPNSPVQKASPLSQYAMSVVQPTIVFSSRHGSKVYAPYGPAQHNYGPIAVATSIVVLALALKGAYSLVR